MKPVSIAVACHTPVWHDNPDALRQSLRARVRDAQCDLLVFAEYAAIEAALIGQPADAPDWPAKGAAAHGLWVDILREAAIEAECHILAGSGPAFEGDTIRNRAILIAPDGHTAYQDKLVPTPWERMIHIEAGHGLTLFDTALGKIGVSICYDAEFPVFSRALAAAGADLILVPACTDTQAGQDRVQIAARARALENQCLVVHAPLVGPVPDCDIIDENIGRAGFFGPPDWGQPEGGVHALVHPETKAWFRAVPDLAAITSTRRSGDVRLFEDWPAQSVPDLPVETVVLGK